MISNRSGTLILFICILPFLSFSQKKTQSNREGALAPAEQLKRFELPEGFVIELVASEKEGIINPIDITFDDRGRLWTQTASMYPLDPIKDISWQDLLELMDNKEKQSSHPAFKRILDLYKGKSKGDDKILILDNLYNDKNVSVSIFEEGLTIPMSILPYGNGVYVVQGSELFYLSDQDRDGKADMRKPLLSGFGFTDSHTMAHSLVKGPGGWIYFSQGALNKGNVYSHVSGRELQLDYSKIARFSLDGKEIELVNSGLNNIWGFQLRGDGQWYGTEANDLGYSVVPMEPGTGFPGIGNEKLRSYQPFLPELHDFRVGGTGISGLAFADDEGGSFPPEFKNVAFLANPITSTINAVRIERNQDGTVTAKHLDDLLTCSDDWFRPVNIEFGPDGCLYIVDWYNKIVSHNELPTTHPDRDKKHGRIWRIRHKGQKGRKIMDFTKVETGELPNYLYAESLWAKRAVWNQVGDRSSGDPVLVRRLKEIAGDMEATTMTRIHALWCLESIGQLDMIIVNQLLTSENDNLIREALRSLASFSPELDLVASTLLPLTENPNPQIRSQIIRTLSELEKVDTRIIEILVKMCKPELPGNNLGGSYERRFERYLSRMVLENYPEELWEYLMHEPINGDNALNVLWASQVLPVVERIQLFEKYWPLIGHEEFSESDFIALLGLVENGWVRDKLDHHIKTSIKSVDYLTYALNNLNAVQTNQISGLFDSTVKRLLSSNKIDSIQLGLKAINDLGMTGFDSIFEKLTITELNTATLSMLISAMDLNVGYNLELVTKMINYSSFDLDLRMKALLSIVEIDPELGIQLIDQNFSNLPLDQRGDLISVFSSSKTGCDVLLKLYESGYLNIDLFDDSSIERINKITSSNAESRLLRERFNQKKNVRKGSEIHSKLDQYINVANSVNGNSIRGRELFETCLLCHRVGNEGQNLGPALDGSAHRNTEALLTAIIDPDAAVESGYSVFRVEKNDDTLVEGYLVEKNENGTTVAFIGGTTTYIKKEDIKQQYFLNGKSFMIKGLIDHYSDQQVADLLEYIGTLK
ncbi:PVC-type heme-binding CxxCH protein [Membranihabitans maritimus]|uniref:PVC-type heme-binding CxxCH protein n=1 Tax=Membranihabitans maritimus TaxID=2904244 RepID=UPI001EFFAB59|nr:PVC-type heme-binding CxxCH protein [Membranihabitans maritimus]